MVHGLCTAMEYNISLYFWKIASMKYTPQLKRNWDAWIVENLLKENHIRECRIEWKAKRITLVNQNFLSLFSLFIKITYFLGQTMTSIDGLFLAIEIPDYYCLCITPCKHNFNAISDGDTWINIEIIIFVLKIVQINQFFGKKCTFFGFLVINYHG